MVTILRLDHVKQLDDIDSSLYLTVLIFVFHCLSWEKQEGLSGVRIVHNVSYCLRTWGPRHLEVFSLIESMVSYSAALLYIPCLLFHG